jgi:chemotaxis receptor (MCP) glutamine deamidase CheD
MLTTILGSCVAMCLRDPGRRGRRHEPLPAARRRGAGTDAGRRYGAYAMELLINDVLKAGARRERLEAKLFGGGRMFDSACATWACQRRLRRALPARRRHSVVGGSLRGDGGRRLHYWPVDRPRPAARRDRQPCAGPGAAEAGTGGLRRRGAVVMLSRSRNLLTAVSDELAEIRAQVEGLSGLTSELMTYCPPEKMGGVMARIQDFDLLIQRLDGLSGLSAALGAGVPMDTALDALTLTDQSNRLSPGVTDASAEKASGDLMLFD